MNKKQLVLALAFPFVAACSISATAGHHHSVDKVTMEVDKKKSHRKEKKAEIRQVIESYMLSKGDISQAELDAREAKRKAAKAELKALKASGNTAKFKARLAQLREERKVLKKEMKAYVKKHEDLQASLKEQKLLAKKGEKRRLINEYMLNNGDITQAQLDARKAKRKAAKAELKALKASGDMEALKLRKEKLRAERKALKQEMKAYIKSHDDLAAMLKNRP